MSRGYEIVTTFPVPEREGVEVPGENSKEIIQNPKAREKEYGYVAIRAIGNAQEKTNNIKDKEDKGDEHIH